MCYFSIRQLLEIAGSHERKKSTRVHVNSQYDRWQKQMEVWGLHGFSNCAIWSSSSDESGDHGERVLQYKAASTSVRGDEQSKLWNDANTEAIGSDGGRLVDACAMLVPTSLSGMALLGQVSPMVPWQRARIADASTM